MRIRIVLASVVVVLLAVTLPITFPVGNFAVAYVRCGHQPIEASRFAAGDSYQLPGDSGYGPNLWAEYFCSETDARAAGFHRVPFPTR